MASITIRKLGLDGQEVYAYPGTVLTRTATELVVEAFFERYERLELNYTVFERGDRFIEYFYADRWYNIFDIRAVGSGARRGWYCNITRPPTITEADVYQIDLALDVWVDPDGTVLILDEDEFAALPLSVDEKNAALTAVAELRQRVARREGPFDIDLR